ncbi:MAG: GntP family permease [Verrucomicrobia bacterium]|nr:GntP family permease [Verrucomicrobiota bacterium]MCF7708549.1 GntP family permease [Verrucomicrobiota bacterium]
MELIATSGAGGDVSAWPFVILLISIVFIITSIAVFRIHAFLSLIMAAILVGFLAPIGSLPGEPEGNHFVQALEVSVREFGNTAGSVGIVIALASIIGICLMESGAADKIVRSLTRAFGEKRVGPALLFSGFFLSIPVFFDTVFFLLIPLAKALRLRTGKNYVLYIMAICAGAVITHSVVAPTPGPLAMAEILKLDLGQSILAGCLLGIIPAVGGWYVSKWLNKRHDFPLRETSGASLKELNAIVNKDEKELPSFLTSIMPVVLPVLLITFSSFLGAFAKAFPPFIDFLGGEAAFNTLSNWADFFGNKNLALLIGAGIALAILVKQKMLSFEELHKSVAPAIESAGVIILITSAGGAFGMMLRHANVGAAVGIMAAEQGINLIILAWVLAVVMKVAQGSGTVSMLTTAGMMSGIMSGAPPPFNPIYVFIVIGFGSIGVSWMNDSGFWVVGRMSGFNEKETLKTWTVLLFAISFLGFIQTLIIASIFPLVPGT